MHSLRPYQQESNDEIAQKYANGFRKLIFQLPTGGGKTITASALIHRFLQSTKKKVLFVVHREELLQQFRAAFYEQYNLVAEPIVAGVKYRNPNTEVYVTMVETANNRLRKNPRWFGDVGLVVIDEAHLGNFSKLHEYFSNETSLIVGLTATPISASKKFPLKNLYEDIICSTDIPDLIAIKALVPNQTFHVKGSVRRDNLKVKNGEFDNAEMFAEYGKSKHIENCVRGYEDHAKGTKTLVFNCNVEHSKMVSEAFTNAGYNSRHLDGSMEKSERLEILNWFKNTPDAILNNIGILTAGFDEPSVQTVIMNRATLSLPLWIQCTGRGSRPYPSKTYFTIIDLGGNALEHGDWCMRRDWAHIFHNPPKPGKGGGVAPVKICVNEECEAIISANANTCSFCGAEQPTKEAAYDKNSVEFELLESSININAIVQDNKQQGYNPYRSLHQAKELIVKDAKIQGLKMDEIGAYNLLELYQVKVAEWCGINGKNYDQWHKETTAQWFFEEVKKQFKWELPKLELAI